MGLRGVNLGGWLVLERWMTPSLFGGLAAGDETAFCVELGREAAPRLRAHWERFVGRADFAWLAQVGIDAVRIPLGHWIFGPPYPHHPRYGRDPHPYVEGGIDVLDRAFDWAEELGLRVLLDLHAAPGCQNGFDNGGMAGVCEWHTRDEYVSYSVDVLGRLAARYGARSSLLGIEVLNEPRWDVPSELLRAFYARARAAIRAHADPARSAVVFHDGFRSHREFRDLLRQPELERAIFDVHRYQCFEPADLALDIDAHVEKARDAWRRELDQIRGELGVPVIVGEWSLGLGPGERSDADYRRYAQAQLDSFDDCLGWFFWSYRTESSPAWCLRECIERGWLAL